MTQHFWVRYGLALFSVVGVYLLYQNFVVPQIDGDSIKVANVNHSEIRHTNPKDRLRHLFGPSAWELQPCKVVETSQGTLLFQEFKKLEGNLVEIRPLTIVAGLNGFKNKGGNAEHPFIIRTHDRAILEFDRPFSLTGGIGEMHGGQLLGDVDIYRLASNAHDDDSLEMQTSNVEIDADTIYTLNEVAFRIGGSHGRGRHLSIKLSGSEGSSEKSPVKSVELAHLAYLHINRQSRRPRNLVDPLDGRGGGSFDAATLSEGSPSAENLGGRFNDDALGSMEVACQGGFKLDMENLVASFKENVRVISTKSGDELACDQLWLYLEQKQPLSDDNLQTTGISEPGSSLDIKQIVAIGNPARLISKQDGGLAQAEHLQFDLRENRIVLRGDRPVELQRDSQFMRAKEIEYLVNEDGSLGNAVATGPGRIVQKPVSEIDQLTGEVTETGRSFSCNWTGDLVIMSENNKKRILLSSRSEIMIDNSSQLIADEISFYLWQFKQTSTDNSGSSKYRYEPYQLLAKGNVDIRTDKLDGFTNDLTVNWPLPVDATPASRQTPGAILLPDTLGYQSEPATRIQVTTVSNRRYVSLRPTLQESTQDSSLVKITSPSQTRKLRFRGDSVTIQMAASSPLADENGEQDMSVEEMMVNGNVVVTQDSPDSPNESLEIRGDSLKAIHLGNELFRMSVIGGNQNAVAITQGINLMGSAINIDQQYNRLWIDGPGQMQVSRTKREEPGQLRDSNNDKPTTIKWQGGMVFDGETFYVERDVITTTERLNEDGTLNLIETSSAALNAKLTRPVKFAERFDGEQTEQAKVELDKIVLVGSVAQQKSVFSNASTGSNRQAASVQPTLIRIAQQDSTGKITGIQTIQVPTATVDTATGDIECAGKGVVQGTMVARKRSTGDQSSGNNLAVRLGNSSKALEYVQVKFDESLKGNLNRNDIVFNGNVRTIYAPIDDASLELDADSKQVTQPGALRLVCDQLQLVQWEPKNSAEPKVEMIATGNAQASGQQFEANSHRISYDQQTENIFLESGSRQDARIYYQKEGTSTRDHLAAETIRYNLATGTTDVDRFKEIDIIHQGPLLNRRK